MYGFLLALMILDGLLLMVVVLLQAGKGGGLGAVGGGAASTENFVGGRQASAVLTKTSWVSGGLFLALALILSIVSSQQQQPESILQGEFQRQTQQTVPQPVLPLGEQGGEAATGEAGGAAQGGESPPASGGEQGTP